MNLAIVRAGTCHQQGIGTGDQRYVSRREIDAVHTGRYAIDAHTRIARAAKMPRHRHLITIDRIIVLRGADMKGKRGIGKAQTGICVISGQVCGAEIYVIESRLQGGRKSEIRSPLVTKKSQLHTRKIDVSGGIVDATAHCDGGIQINAAARRRKRQEIWRDGVDGEGRRQRCSEAAKPVLNLCVEAVGALR